MPEATLDRLLQLSEHLCRLSRAGVPIDLDSDSSRNSSNDRRVEEIISRANAALKLRVELGQPLVEAIEAAPELPPPYRASLKTWLQMHDPTAAMDALTLPAQQQRAVKESMSVSLIQPALIVVLTFFAFIVLCSFTVPQLVALDAQVWRKPTGALAILQHVREAMPVWIVVIPILFVTAWIAWRRNSMWLTLHGWFPGGRRYLDTLRYARFSEQIATLLEQDVPLDQSLRLADPVLRARFDSEPESMPPLLRWALVGDLGGEPLPSVLRFVSLTYRQIADQYSVIWRTIVPAFLAAFLGGLLVLAYGLSLFLPLVDMLKHIAFPELLQ